MAIKNSEAFTFKAAGLSDAVDATNAPGGAMALLQNLVPSPKTQSVYVCRPAALTLTAFAGFNTPTRINALKVCLLYTSDAADE